MKTKLFTLISVLFFLTLFSQVQVGNSIFGLPHKHLSQSATMSKNGQTVAVNFVEADNTYHIKIYELTNNQWLQKGNSLDISFGYYPADNTFNFDKYSTIVLSDDGNVVSFINKSIANNITTYWVEVFEFANSNWQRKGNILFENNDTNNFISYYGLTMSSDGNRIAVGTEGLVQNSAGNSLGEVFVFDYSNNNWAQFGQTITGEIINNNSSFLLFKPSIKFSSDGNTLLVGAPASFDNNIITGRIRIFEVLNNIWTQKGADIIGNTQQGEKKLGSSTAISADGNIIAIGSHRTHITSNFDGSVTVYAFNGTNWNSVGQRIEGEIQSTLAHIISLSNDGNTLAVSNHRYTNDDGGLVGRALVYRNINNVWSLIYFNVGEHQSHYVGYGVTLNNAGTRLMFCALGEHENVGGGGENGALKVFDFEETASTTNFNQQQISIYPNPSNKTLKVDILLENANITISNNLGKTVFKKVNATNNEINIESLPKGIYYINIQDNYLNKTFKFIKN